MSLSGGIKKYNSKNYHVELISDSQTITKFKIQPWTRVHEIKTKISNLYGVSNKYIRLFYLNTEMVDHLSMLDYMIIDDKHPKIYYKITDGNISELGIQVYGNFPCPNKLKGLIEDVRHGFLAGLIPTLIMDGTSGTYNMRNTNKEVVALFKPFDEEAFTPNNQKGFAGKFGQESFRKGILSGEGSIREVAAYLIDKSNYFNVPETTFVEIANPSFNNKHNDLLTIQDESFHLMRNSIIHTFLRENVVPVGESNNNDCTVRKKYGSLQRFMKSNDVAANFATTLFDVGDVHKLGVLDIRILNCDRNDENILVVKKKDKAGKIHHRLIPIDHSLSLPDCIKISEYEMCWMGWDQAKVPFCKEMLSYIKSINYMEDMKRLSTNIKLREKCWKNFRVANIVLKLCAEKGLTLYDIGMILYRPKFDETPSEVELIMEKASKLSSVYSNINVDTYSLLNLEKNASANISTDNLEDNNETDLNIIVEGEEQKEEEKCELIKINLNEEEDHIDSEKSNSNTNLFKRRHTLLKRTASEPKLAVFNRSSDLISLDIETVKPNILDKEKGGQKQIKGKTMTNNGQPKGKGKIGFNLSEEKDEFDSPYNELYFCTFEDLLIEFLAKYPNK